MRHPFPLGRRPSDQIVVDPRSANFPVTVAPVVTKTWRHYSILDQGQHPSCTGNAIAGALNAKPLHQSGTPLLREADAVNLWTRATQLDPYPGQMPEQETGSDGSSVCKAAREAGHITGWTNADGFDAALGALMLGTVLSGTDWTSAMFYPDPDGRVRPNGSKAGGHEYVLYGVNLLLRRVKFLNSWGAAWGVRGCFWMTFEDFTALLNDGGDAIRPERV